MIDFFYRHRRMAFGVLLIVLLIVLVPTFSQLSLDEILNFSPESTMKAVIILLGLYAIKPIIMLIPIYALYIAAGLFFPRIWALVITYLGLACELSVGYLVGRMMGGSQVSQLMERYKHTKKLLNTYNNNQRFACFLSRIMPVPPDLFSYFFGSAAMPFPRYLLFSLLGMSPAMIPVVWAGTAITNPLQPEFLVPVGITLVFSFITYSLYEKLGKNGDDRDDKNDGEDSSDSNEKSDKSEKNEKNAKNEKKE